MRNIRVICPAPSKTADSYSDLGIVIIAFMKMTTYSPTRPYPWRHIDANAVRVSPSQ